MRRTGWGKGEERWAETQKSARYRLREREREGKQRMTDRFKIGSEGGRQRERKTSSQLYAQRTRDKGILEQRQRPMDE